MLDVEAWLARPQCTLVLSQARVISSTFGAEDDSASKIFSERAWLHAVSPHMQDTVVGSMALSLTALAVSWLEQ